MTTVHLIYPHGSRISCPDAIGRNVGNRLREQFEVKQYNWDDIGVLHPGSDDILIGAIPILLHGQFFVEVLAKRVGSEF